MKIKKILAFVCAVSVCMAGFVQNFEDISVSEVVYAEDTLEKDGFCYIVLDDGTIELTEYTGKESKVVIPEKIDGKTVTSLDGTFSSQKLASVYFINNVIIPDTVTNIGNGTFDGCSQLKDISIPESVKSIGERAFATCAGLTKLVIPDSVTSIGKSAFFNCKNLSEIKLSKNITRIEEDTFHSCFIVEIEVPDGVTYIGENAFDYCWYLTKITVPASVKESGDRIFDIRYLDKLVIHGYENSYMQKYAAENNIKFEIIGTAPDESGKTEDDDPGKTDADKPEYQEKDGMTYSVSDKETVEIAKYTGSDTKVVIPEKIDGKTVTSIISGAFEGCTDVSEISIPETVDYIGYNAFTGTKWLEEQKKVNPMYPVASVNDILIDAKSLGEVFDHISVVKGTRSIAGGAFENCKDVKEINIPDSVTFIGEKAFNNCTGLTKLIVPDSVTSIEKDAFAGCTKLVIYGNKNSYIEKYASENKIKFELIPEPVKGSGDINSDGKLDASDLLTVQIWFYGETKLNDAQKAAMDLNEDGKLNIVDICLLKEKLLSGN